MEIGSYFWSIKSDSAADFVSTQRVKTHFGYRIKSMYVWEKGK